MKPWVVKHNLDLLQISLNPPGILETWNSCHWTVNKIYVCVYLEHCWQMPPLWQDHCSRRYISCVGMKPTLCVLEWKCQCIQIFGWVIFSPELEFLEGRVCRNQQMRVHLNYVQWCNIFALSLNQWCHHIHKSKGSVEISQKGSMIYLSPSTADNAASQLRGRKVWRRQ